MRVTTPIYETILYILLINFTPTLYSLTLLYHLKSIKKSRFLGSRKRDRIKFLDDIKGYQEAGSTQHQ